MLRDLAPLTPSFIRNAYEQAARYLVDVVGAVTADQWSQPGLGVWTVRELTGHASRALLTVLSGLDNPPTTIAASDPFEYYRVVFDRPHEGMHETVAARGREAGAAFGDDPAVAVWQFADRVLNRLADTRDDTVCTTIIGGMRLIDYLPSRVVELTVHALDLARATEQSLSPPESAAQLTTAVILGLADPTRAIFALTGRGEYNVFA